MIILGIDPGIATLGYGVVEKDANGNCKAVDYGVVVTPKDEALPVRLAILEEGVGKILDAFQPDEIAMEELFFSKNITTGIAVAHARGVVMLSCIKRCGKLYEYTPMQIKQALTGYGRADKQQIQQVVTSLLHLQAPPKPDDAADALAIALCHSFASRFGELFAVGNMTRTKGQNAVTGSAFQSMMKDQGKKQAAKNPSAKTQPLKKMEKSANVKSVAGQPAKSAVKKSAPASSAAALAAKVIAGLKEKYEEGEK